MARRRKGDPIHGWVVIDKPEGPTSTDVVNKVRRGLNAQKAGHGGTLDPLATGLLAIALGEATKTIPYVMDADKTYRFAARWGESRSTDDREGEVLNRSDVRPTPEQIEAALTRFIGEVEQLPPTYSAIKIDGERAYDLARAGETVELTPRTVHIHTLRLVNVPEPDYAVFEMTCGKGTYVRSLVRDLGEALGTCAHVHKIRRTHTGGFTEKHAILLDNWLELVHNGHALEHVLPVETPLDDIPAVAVTGSDATKLRNGQSALLRDIGVLERIKAASKSDGDSQPTVLCSFNGRPVALCQYRRGELKPSRVFNLPL